MTDDRAKKTAAGFTASESRRLEQSGAIMWAHVLAHVASELFARSETVSRGNLIAALEAWASNRDALSKAGSAEAIRRLQQPIPEGHDQKG